MKMCSCRTTTVAKLICTGSKQQKTTGMLQQKDFPEMPAGRQRDGGRFIFVFQKKAHNKYSLLCHQSAVCASLQDINTSPHEDEKSAMLHKKINANILKGRGNTKRHLPFFIASVFTLLLALISSPRGRERTKARYGEHSGRKITLFCTSTVVKPCCHLMCCDNSDKEHLRIDPSEWEAEERELCVITHETFCQWRY